MPIGKVTIKPQYRNVGSSAGLHLRLVGLRIHPHTYAIVDRHTGIVDQVVYREPNQHDYDFAYSAMSQIIHHQPGNEEKFNPFVYDSVT